jgi:xylan 1,4-beta-xylosidase
LNREEDFVVRQIMLALSFAMGLAAAPAVRAAPQATFDWFDYAGKDPVFEAFQPKAGEYRNPVLTGFYPDPSVVRVGPDYYLVNSTFGYFPGIPVFHSRDLVHWTQIGNAIDRPGQLDFKTLSLGGLGVFAPAISEHDGTFYIVNTCVGCGGNFVITAKDPKGPWSDPVWLPEVDGIDASLFIDEDGRAFIVNCGSPQGGARYDGHTAIWIQAFDLKALKTVGPRSVLVDAGVHPEQHPRWIEGPHLFRFQGKYYLTAAEGGTEQGHSEVAFRADSPTGPYVPAPINPILTQRDLPKDRPWPITSSGHAQLFQTQEGDWWAVFLAVRPYGDDLYNTGRETFLAPVTWRDGWPVILPKGEAIPWTHAAPALPAQPVAGTAPAGNFSLHQDFGRQALGLEWLRIRNPKGDWLSQDRRGLHLSAEPVGLGDMGSPAYVGRRQQHAFASAATEVRFRPEREGDRAGLAAFANDNFYYALSVTLENGRRVVRLDKRAGPKEPADGVEVASAPLDGPADGPVRLRIEAKGGAYDFAYAGKSGRWMVLAKDQPGDILSTRVAGGFIGATFGLYAIEARAK